MDEKRSLFRIIDDLLEASESVKQLGGLDDILEKVKILESFVDNTSNYEKFDQRLRRMEELCAVYQKNVLSMKEASIYTGYRESYLHRLVQNHEIAYSKPKGKYIFFDKSDLESFMMSNHIPSNRELAHKALLESIRDGNARTSKTRKR